jgi:DNA-binding CsgD family transcriptional regulator
LFDSSPVAVGVCDGDLRIVVVNGAWAAMDGLAPEDHKGKTVREVLDVVACPVEAAMRHVLITGEPIFGLEVVAKVPTRPNVGRWIVNLIPLKDGAGNTTHVGNVTVETTPRASFESFLVARGDATHHGSVSKADRELEQNVMRKLSPREIEVTRLLAHGKSNKEIALVLRISVKTVETHRRRAMKNLNFHSLAELAVYAVRRQII